MIDFRSIYCFKVKISRELLYAVINAFVIWKTIYDDSSQVIFVGIDMLGVTGGHRHSKK